MIGAAGLATVFGISLFGTTGLETTLIAYGITLVGTWGFGATFMGAAAFGAGTVFGTSAFGATFVGISAFLGVSTLEA